MKIQIFGYGFVGRAHALAFSSDYHVYDPALGSKDINKNADAVIIAVSTPEGKDGACDMSNVFNAIELSPDAPILIKSTISLEGWRSIKEMFPDKNISFSPEFLRADYAMEDFKNQEIIYLGGDGEEFWYHALSEALDVRVETTDPEALILAKYMRNSFLATKVAFFNQMYDMCKEYDIDYTSVAYTVSDDDRIGNSHTFITEERGFGGHCFPKDTAAIVHSGKKSGVNLSIIEEAINYNKKIRK